MPWPLGLLVFVDFREFGVDHFFVTRRSFGGRLGRLGSLLAARRLRFLVDRLAELHGGLSQSFGLGLGHGGLDLALERFVDLVAMALLATVATLVLYLFATIAALRLMVRGQLSRGLLFVTLVGAVYSIWTFYGAGKEATLWGLLLLMTAIPVWFGMRLSSLWSSPAPAAAPAGPPESLS